MFTIEQKTKLAAPLDGSKVKTRELSGVKLSYLEGWQVIEFANEVFGFDGWSRETVQAECVSQQEKKLRSGDGWGVTYTAKVKITVGEVVREGFGAGSGNDRDLGQAHESAVKEAETDAMKRALMTFGYGFGLALYDKTQANVEGGGTQGASQSRRPASSSSKPTKANNNNRISEAQLGRYVAITKAHDWSEAAQKALLGHFGITSRKAIPRARYGEIVATLEAEGKAKEWDDFAKSSQEVA